MSRHLQKAIESLMKRLIGLSAKVEENFRLALKALEDRDSELAKRVIEIDEEVDKEEIDIEEDCLKILALHQPVAIDLRFIIAALKINNDLERIGDLAVNIAQRSMELLKQSPLKPLIDIPRMAEIAQQMVKDAIDAFVNRNDKLAKSVCERDDEVDDLNDQIFRELLTYMMQDPKTIEKAVELILVGRHLERIADHATNIGEDVIYMVKGKTIKHHSA